MTDFRAMGTIMGLAGLTAVFGMGTGGAPPVSSPESGRGVFRPPRPSVVPMVGHAGFAGPGRAAVAFIPDEGRRTVGIVGWSHEHPDMRPAPAGDAAAGRGGQAVGC